MVATIRISDTISHPIKRASSFSQCHDYYRLLARFLYILHRHTIFGVDMTDRALITNVSEHFSPASGSSGSSGFGAALGGGMLHVILSDTTSPVTVAICIHPVEVYGLSYSSL